MEIIILGCGFSLGCPVLACSCKVCISNEKYNKRTRSAILISSNAKNILVDFGQDIKTQLLNHNIKHIDAVICTHAHNDHIAGLDELRVFGYNQKKPVPLYTNKETMDNLMSRSNYLFNLHEGLGPFVKDIIIDDYENINIEGLKFQFFNQIHGINESLGFRIGDFVYSNDITEFPEETEKYLHNIENWVLDCIDYKRTTAHAGLEEVLKWNLEYKPKNIYLTDMSHNLDYHEIKSKLPDNIVPCFDGIKIIVNSK